MAESTPEKKSAPRKQLLLGALAASLALAVVILSWLVIIPVTRVRAALARASAGGPGGPGGRGHIGQAADELGDPERAARQLGVYLRMPEFLAPERLAATAALGFCGRYAVPRLTGLLDDQDPAVRRAATLALGNTGAAGAGGAVEPLIAALEREDLLACAASALGALGDARAAGPLSRKLGHPDQAVRRDLSRAMAALGSASVDALLAALAGPDSLAREAAAEALGLVGDARAARPLAGALEDKNARVREKAAWALGRIKVFSPALIAALEDEATPVRAAAAEALRLINDPLAVEPLIAALKDKKAPVRAAAAEALGLLKDRRAIEPLKPLLTDEDESVRKKAWKAIDCINIYGRWPRPQ